MERIYQIVDDLNQKFGNQNPFQIMTRLAEEVGELAQQINHHESQGIKIQKHGQPDKEKLAKEVQDVIRCALQISRYYQIEDLLDRQITERVNDID